MRFIHCADLHLDTAFSGLGEAQRAVLRQAELRQTFLRIIEKARGTDALLIAGDLFDQAAVEAETLRVLERGFASLGDTQVLIAAGNHDPLCEKSYYKTAHFSPNVHIFGVEPSCVTVADCDVWGVSFKQAVQPDTLFFAPSVQQSERPAILLMHGNLGGDDYNPISREQVALSGFSYLALGHVHTYGSETIGKTLCVYSGCPEGRGFDELDEKGVISGEVTKTDASAVFEPICKRRYRELTVDVSGLTTHEDIRFAIEANDLAETDLYKIILTGETELLPDCALLAKLLTQPFFVKVYDRTKRPLSPADLVREGGLRGSFAEKLLSGLSGAEAERYRRALEYGLAAINGERVKGL